MTTLTVDARSQTLTVPAGSIYAPAYDWYVDSVNGSDTYNGQSPWMPFATIAKLLTVLGASDSVALAKGSSWREKYTTALDDVVTVTYGSGAAPLLDCSVVAANASFTKTVGQTNVYEIAVTVDYSASEPMWNSVWENDVRLVRATSVANCDATPGSMYPSNDNNAAVTLYVHASDSSSVITNGKTYEYAKWLSGYYSYFATGCGLNGIRSRRNLSEGGSIKIGKTSIAVDCTAEEGGKHNVYCRTGCWLENVIADGAYYTGGSFTMFVFNDDTPASEGVTFKNCQANLDAYDPSGAGFYGHKNISGSFGAVVYDGCTATNLSAAFQGQDAAIVATGCTATNCANGFWVIANTSFTITDSIVNSNVVNSRAVVSQGNGITVAIDGLTTSLSADGGIGIFISHTTPTITISGDGMTIVGKAGQTYAIRHTSTGGTINVSNSSFSTCYQVYSTSAGAATVTSDYNRFVQDIGSRIGGTDYATVALYQAATGQDAHSTIG